MDIALFGSSRRSACMVGWCYRAARLTYQMKFVGKISRRPTNAFKTCFTNGCLRYVSFIQSRETISIQYPDLSPRARQYLTGITITRFCIYTNGWAGYCPVQTALSIRSRLSSGTRCIKAQSCRWMVMPRSRVT